MTTICFSRSSRSSESRTDVTHRGQQSTLAEIYEYHEDFSETQIDIDDSAGTVSVTIDVSDMVPRLSTSFVLKTIRKNSIREFDIDA